MVGCGAQTGTNDEHIAKLDVRLHALLSAQECHANTMARLGELGVRSIQASETLVDDRKAMRDFLRDGLALDPTVGDALTKIANTLEAGKVLSAWEQAKKRVEVENKREAERVSQNLPPQLTTEVVVMLKKQFEKAFNRNIKLNDAACPSKPYLELKIGHVESNWEAERLTEVTSLAQAKRFAMGNANTKTFGMDEAAMGFKLVTKPFGVPMPGNSESLRARLKLMRNTFMFLKLKFPQKGVLATCSLAMWDDYTDFLFGDEVWGFTIKGADGKPFSCPHQGHVEGFDQAIRDKVASSMSEGMDIEAAFEDAKKDVLLKNTSFLTYFTTEVNSKRCTALSAPNFLDINGTGGPASSSAAPKRVLDHFDGEPQLTKKQRKAANKKAKAAEEKKQMAQAAKAAKGTGKGTRAQLAFLDAPRGAARPTKGRSKGKQKTSDNVSICFAYNNGQPCKVNPCPYAHVCQLCEEKHPKGECPNAPAAPA